MKPMDLNIDRRGFLKLSAMTAATPILMGSSGILPVSAAMAGTGANKIFPGVYTDTEKRLLAETDQLMDSLVGWTKAEKFEVDREASMKAYAGFTDPGNPFYTDNAYAKDARWGELVAVPTYAAKIGVSEYQMPSTKAYPAKSMMLLGEDIDFYRPIRKSDSFRVWNRRPMYKDVTPPSGKGPRTFIIKVSDLDVVNQDGLLVHSYKNYIEQYFWPEKVPDAEPMKEYVYTKEELTYLDELEACATVRGSAIRYWEEVSVGEKISPVALGPITDEIISDFMDACMAGIPEDMAVMELPGAGKAKRRDSLQAFERDSASGGYRIAFGSRAARSARETGGARAYSGASLSRAMLGRLVTNWMGDDGFLRKFHYRRFRRDFIGDTMIVRGVVADKRVHDGEHLVDIDAWIENMRGNVTGAAAMSVRLFTKSAPVQRDEV